jgi:hypothetical protein
VSPKIKVFGLLLMAGELFGSRMSGTSHRASYVGVQLDSRDGKDFTAYGRVQFFFTHKFGDDVHYFASIIYHSVVDPKLRTVEQVKIELARSADFCAVDTNDEVKDGDSKATIRAREECAKAIKDKLSKRVDIEAKRILRAEKNHAISNPNLNPTPDVLSNRNIIPVQRIAFRFIPCIRQATKANPQTKTPATLATMQACKCPPKSHA